MTAHVYPASDWFRARAHRAAAGKAPRIAVRRYICVRPGTNNLWATCICECRFGKWKAPEWLCGATSLDDARATAIDAWRKYRLPLMWASNGRLRPFMVAAPQALMGGNRHVV